MIPRSQLINDKIKKIFIIAGEESGDAHGSRLVKELSRQYPNIEFIGHGGDKMKTVGVKIIEHISKLSLVGFTEVVKHIPFMKRVMQDTIKLIEQTKPNRIILIDYPGFNLRLAKKLNPLNIPITYFILPQVWAWKENRATLINNFVDQAISIIPFEKDWFKKRGIEIDYVGHPFAEIEMPTISKQSFFSKHGLIPEEPLLTLLPGSRQQEIDRHWPIFLTVVECLLAIFPNLQFLLGKAPNVNIPNCPDYIKVEKYDIQVAMRYSEAGLAASGTATLEACALGLPAVVCYKTSSMTYWIGRFLAKVNWLSLVNLIANRQIVPEFIQNNMSTKALVKTLIPLLSDTPEKDKMLEGYKEVLEKLGEPGVYKRSAKLIIEKFNG